MNKEEIKQIFLDNIEDNYTINLAIALAEEWEEYKKEIDRLSNAFDELEKYLIEGTKESHYVYGDMFFDEACEIILNKLKELRNK